MRCVNCHRKVDGPLHNGSEITCTNCLMVVVNEIDRLGLPPFSVNGLHRALAGGNLASWMKLHDLNPTALERWTGIDKILWKKWAEEDKKVTDIKISDVKASVDAVLREARGRTYVVGQGNMASSQNATSEHF